VRYRPNRELPCWVNVVLVGSSWLAEVLDISTEGIGISSACWLPAESHLLVRLADADNIARTFLAHVRHATPRAGGDFHLGTRLVNHLSEEQVRELIRK